MLCLLCGFVFAIYNSFEKHLSLKEKLHTFVIFYFQKYNKKFWDKPIHVFWRASSICELFLHLPVSKRLEKI